MHRRGYQLGEEVPLLVQCTDAAGRPVDPDACPRVAVYDAAGHAVADVAVPVLDRAETTGLFLARLYLDSVYLPGHYAAQFRWTSGAYQGGKVTRFEVQVGGGESGQVIAMFSYERPHANFIVQQRGSGRIYKGRNPRVT